MKYYLFLFLFVISHYGYSQQIDYNSYPVYEGNDLGLTYSASHSIFRIWSPPASEVQLIFYKTGIGGKPVSTLSTTNHYRRVLAILFID